MNIYEKTLVFFGSVIAFTIVFAIFAIILSFNIYSKIVKYNNNPYIDTENLLFKYSYVAHGRYNISYGYYIFNNGEIKEYDDYDKDRKLKYSQLSEDEIQKLYELSTLVQDEFIYDAEVPSHDIGISTMQIYNIELSKWVMLSSGGDLFGRNRTQIGEEILQLIKEISIKYLNDEKYQF